MCDLYESVNIRTAVSFKKLLDMLSVLWCFSSVKEAEKVGITQRSDICEPFKLVKPNLVIFITLTTEQKPRNVLIHKVIRHFPLPFVFFIITALSTAVKSIYFLTFHLL